jgi:hypothetical protein
MFTINLLQNPFLHPKFSGGIRGGETPVPMPNTAVKPSIVDGTAPVREWESRTLPGLNSKSPSTPKGFFLARN